MNIMKQQGTTLVQRACAKINGFKALHKRLEKKIVVSGKSMSTLYKYMRCIAHVSLKYNCLPTKLSIDEDHLMGTVSPESGKRHFKIASLKYRTLATALQRIPGKRTKTILNCSVYVPERDQEELQKNRF